MLDGSRRCRWRTKDGGTLGWRWRIEEDGGSLMTVARDVGSFEVEKAFRWRWRMEEALRWKIKMGMEHGTSLDREMENSNCVIVINMMGLQLSVNTCWK